MRTYASFQYGATLFKVMVKVTEVRRLLQSDIATEKGVLIA